jgi:acyl-coenzyme A thioesterase PaaI-like protein
VSEATGTPAGMQVAHGTPQTPDWWAERITPTPPTGYAEMIEALRVLQDRVAAAVPDADLVSRVTKHLVHAAELLEPAERDETHRLSGGPEDLHGRGSALIPVLEDVETDPTSLRGRVRFRRFHLGGNGAAHGGTIPLLFDDVLGRFANASGRALSRTAYLHVNYRNVTPVGRDLDLEVRFEREDGRKRYVTGVLRDGDTICADAEGLFVELRIGHP